MKNKVEIYSIRFNHLKTATDLLCTTYTIGVPHLAGNTLKTPTKITIDHSGKWITTYFNDDTSHSIALTEDVEYFKRIIKNAKETQDTTNERGIRESNSTE